MTLLSEINFRYLFHNQSGHPKTQGIEIAGKNQGKIWRKSQLDFAINMWIRSSRFSTIKWINDPINF